MTDLRGTWFVVPTPFHDDGGVDLESQGRVVEAAIRWRVDGLTAMGITSEAAALGESERAEALEAIFRAAAGRVPVTVGCSAAEAEEAVRRARHAAGLGAVAAMVAAPPDTRDVEALPRFFSEVREGGGVPLVVQDEPAATGVTIPVEVLLRCAEAAEAAAIKLEDPPTPPKIARLLEGRPSLRVFGGLGGVAALSELRRGAAGTMTGFAFPEVLAAVRRRVEEGDGDGAAGIFDRHLPLIVFEAQKGIGLGIRKELLRRRGAIATAVTRVGPRPDAATLAELGEVLRRVDVDPSPEPLSL